MTKTAEKQSPQTLPPKELSFHENSHSIVILPLRSAYYQMSSISSDPLRLQWTKTSSYTT